MSSCNYRRIIRGSLCTIPTNSCLLGKVFRRRRRRVETARRAVSTAWRVCGNLGAWLRPRATLWLWILVVSFGSAAREPQAVPIRITHHARALQPGEAVRITVTGARPLQRVDASVFQREFSLYAGMTPVQWQGLIGIDLETKPGTYDLKLQISYQDGASETLSHELAIKGKTFPTRRLTVDEKFVNPPPETLDRIARNPKWLRRSMQAAHRPGSGTAPSLRLSRERPTVA